MLSNLINEDYMANLETENAESMEVMNIESASAIQQEEVVCELNCCGTFGTLGSAGACFGTFGTLGCAG